MSISTQVKTILQYNGLTISEFAKMMGNSPQTIRNIFYRGNLKYSTLEHWMDVLGCDIVFRDRKTGKIFE